MQLETCFTDCVLRSFDSLISEYGFQCVRVEKNRVRFESDKVFVKIGYDAFRSYELDCAVGLLSDKGQKRPMSLMEILRLANAEKKEFYTIIQASTPERLEKHVPRLADLLERYGREFLLGKHEIFDID